MRTDRGVTRRDFVRGAAGTMAVVAAGGVAGIGLWDRSTRPDAPDAAWQNATGLDRVVLAAALAPSSHNTQPWRFRVHPDGIDIVGDRDRTMGQADPRLRELHVSLGCAAENALLAAAAAGTPMSFEIGSDGPGAHFAALRFASPGDDLGADPRLAAAIPLRRTNRGPYDATRAVPPADLDDLGALASKGIRAMWLSTPSDLARFRDLSVSATEAHIADRSIQRASHRWYRMSRADAERHRDGITVSGANLPAIASVLMGLFPPTPESFDTGWTEATRDTHCGTAPAVGLLVADATDDRTAWVEAGRTYERIQLAATLRGIATHPISQALTIRDREHAAGAPGAFCRDLAALGGTGEVVLAFRIGRPTREQAASLRRSPVVEEV